MVGYSSRLSVYLWCAVRHSPGSRSDVQGQSFSLTPLTCWLVRSSTLEVSQNQYTAYLSVSGWFQSLSLRNKLQAQLVLIKWMMYCESFQCVVTYFDQCIEWCTWTYCLVGWYPTSYSVYWNAAQFFFYALMQPHVLQSHRTMHSCT